MLDRSEVCLTKIHFSGLGSLVHWNDRMLLGNEWYAPADDRQRGSFRADSVDEPRCGGHSTASTLVIAPHFPPG